ncbi:hypothetical protein ACFQI7_30715 [Paenibacillus allorhizosphaerae]|uniref:Uncharacterized protein n=1 Tax=Paenibacillus allorhizosphaerae TaxID=2849866 RepID=A0ABM8VPQ9_9BACL|nr:hypothetical protein [Paenibacillus allorhizosphaerae]CAG7653252.1 hypothetical protein PAECIP111802_05440 [Paenibacillus allorhizosphaerae]
MNQDTNRPVRPEQEKERDMTTRWPFESEMPLPPRDGYRPQPYAPLPAETEPRRGKPWHSQGWLWLIVAVIAIGVMGAGLLMLAGEIGGIRSAIHEQTDVIREQNGLLNDLSAGLDRLTAAVSRVAEAVRDAVSHWLASM